MGEDQCVRRFHKVHTAVLLNPKSTNAQLVIDNASLVLLTQSVRIGCGFISKEQKGKS